MSSSVSWWRGLSRSDLETGSSGGMMLEIPLNFARGTCPQGKID